MKNKVLITGSSGFVGTNLIESLNNKYNFILPDRYNLKNSLNKEKNYDVLIHLAGIAHDTKRVNDDMNYFRVNTDLTKFVFNKFVESNAKVFIFLSSVKACSDSVEGIMYESDISNPSTAYGKSKLKAENYIIENLNQIKDNKKVYILRPSMIHGPNNKGNLNLLLKMINKGIPWPLGLYENKRSFCGINNLIFVIQNLIEKKNINTGIYNIADDLAISTNELYELICDKLNKRKLILKIPKFLIKIIAFFGDYFSLPLNTERLEKLTESYVVSNSKIKEQLNISNFPDSVRDSFNKTLVTFI